MQEKKINSLIRTLFIILIIILSILSGFLGGMYASSDLFKTHNNKANTTSSEPNMTNILSIEQIAELNKNSVVEIQTESVVRDSWLSQYVREGAGSGVIISSDGYIITNNHVIEKSQKISVTLSNGKKFNAKLIGRDSDSDIAVLKIKSNKLVPAQFGDSDKLKVGELSVIIGNPLGNLGGSVTSGILSSLNRNITLGQNSTQVSSDNNTLNLLQTDAPVNPGNSGGGMFNKTGHLIGIVVAKSSGPNVEGLGFAIPINTAKHVAEKIIKYGYVPGKPALGVVLANLDEQSRLFSFDFSQNYSKPGIYVSELISDNAKKSNLEVGDMLYSIDNKRIENFNDVISALSKHHPDEIIDISVIRNNETLKFEIKLSDKNKINITS